MEIFNLDVLVLAGLGFEAGRVEPAAQHDEPGVVVALAAPALGHIQAEDVVDVLLRC